MTHLRPGLVPSLALCLGLMAAPAVLAQSGGGGGGGSSGGASGSSTGGQAGQSPASSGPSGPGRRAQTEPQLRDAGAAPSPEQEAQQLRDLNAISRQLTPPGAQVPAPEAERR